MIRAQELVPDYYVEKSRDFQVLCRLFDFVLNSVRYNTNSMQSLTDTKSVKDTALPLVGDKFGIYDKDAYSNREMLEALPEAIKHKGSLLSVNILINAFLISMGIFQYAMAFNVKDEKTKDEVEQILNRKVRNHSIVIVLSSFPSLTNLHILDTYLKMVIPTGLAVEYAFGTQIKNLDKVKQKEYVFLFYTDTDANNYPMVSTVKNYEDKYKAIFTTKENVPDWLMREITRDDTFNAISEINATDINSVGIASVVSREDIMGED